MNRRSRRKRGGARRTPGTGVRWRRVAPIILLLAAAAVFVARMPPGAFPKPQLERAAGQASELVQRIAYVLGHAPSARVEHTAEGEIRVVFGPAPLEGGPRIGEKLVAHLNAAASSIYCACYELDYMPVAHALITQHRAGLAVGFVSDSDYASRPATQALIDAGIQVVFDERSAFMHNKFCVIDGERVWTGSANFTVNGFHRNNNNAVLIHSTHIAENYLAEFDEMWRRRQFGPGSPANTPYPVIEMNGVRIRTLFAPEDNVEPALAAKVDGARESIDFMLFAFTSLPLAEAMAARIAEGVRVRGLLDRRNAGSRHSRGDFLAERGADIHLDANPGAMHHKTMVIDTAIVVTGSYNFSRNAHTRNDENVIIIHDAALAERFIAELERLLP